MIYVYEYHKNFADKYFNYLSHHNWWQTNKDNNADGHIWAFQNNQYREKILIIIDDDTNELQIITLTNFSEEINNDYASKDEDDFQYYKGTRIPTYTSVTRYNIHDTYITDENNTMYIYLYNENAVFDYINTLNKNGWDTTFSSPNNQDISKYILTNNTYKEQVLIGISPDDGLVFIMTETNLIECYPGTNIPTYTSITGDEIIDVFDAKNNVTIYSYVEDDVSLTNYIDFIGRNGWDVDVVDGDDGSYCNVVFTSQTKSNQTFVMSVEFALEEIWIYIQH